MILRPEAESDLESAQSWYDQQREGLGAAFLNAVRQVFEKIEGTPLLYAQVYQEVRCASVRRFPYLVFYRLVGEEVEVIAVVDARRDPEAWKTRV